MNKLAVTGLLAGSAVTRMFATAFGPGPDMATLNDYSADKKRLYLRRRRGLLLIVR